MGERSELEKELEREREKLNRMMNKVRETHEPGNDEILEQSRKVDKLLVMIQKARINRGSRTKRPRNGQER
jgi:hypothetical protein